MQTWNSFLSAVRCFAVATAALLVPNLGACQETTALKESDLIAVLRSDAPASEKAIACKHLSVHGSSAAVPALAPLLADEQLASWARIALEAIPGKEADAALREAAASLQGKLLVGVINSLGVRRDAVAVELLTDRLKDDEVSVASAAAIALGKIGNRPAADALRKALADGSTKSRSEVAEGLVLCAERFHASGDAVLAVEVYDEVRRADVPWQRMLEATRGAILARGPEGIPLLVEQLRSPHKGLFQLGLSTAREFPGSEVDQALAGELERSAPERAALIVQAMADRPNTVVLTALLKAAGSGPKPVRLAAVTALGKVGNATCLAPLLDIAIEQDAELTQAAKAALAALPEAVNPEIAAQLTSAQGPLYPLLIELLGLRRIEATDALVKALNHSDKAIRTAALKSLGSTVPPQRLSVLITQVVSPRNADDAAAAQQALKEASVRMPDREACAAELAAALERSPTATKLVLLDILAAVGGAKALQTVGAAARSTDPQLQDVSSRLLGEWMTIDAAPVLIDLAKTGPAEFQVRSLRGYIRVARQFVMPDDERVAMCRLAFDVARRPDERKLVLDVLKRYPNLETLKLAVKATEAPDVKDDAVQAAVAIAQKVGENKPEVRELLTKAGVKK